MSLVKNLFILFIGLISAMTSAQKSDFSNRLDEANSLIYTNPPEAIQISERVLEATDSDDLQITALIIQVNAYDALGELGKSFELARKTLEVAEKSGKVHHKIWALGQMGEEYQKVRLNTVSRQFLDRALMEIQNSQLSEENKAVSLGNIFAIKGNGYKEEIDCKIAIQNYDQAIASYLAVPADRAAENNLALVYLEKGNCLLDLKDFEKAEENFLAAEKIAKKNKLQEYEMEAQLGFAKIAASLNQPEKVIEIAERIQNSVEESVHLNAKNELYYLLQNAFAGKNPEKYKEFREKFLKSSHMLRARENERIEQVLELIIATDFRENTKWPVILLGASFLFFLVALTFKLTKKDKTEAVLES